MKIFRGKLPNIKPPYVCPHAQGNSKLEYVSGEGFMYSTNMILYFTHVFDGIGGLPWENYLGEGMYVPGT